MAYLVLFFKEIVEVTFLFKPTANLIFIKVHEFCCTSIFFLKYPDSDNLFQILLGKI